MPGGRRARGDWLTGALSPIDKVASPARRQAAGEGAWTIFWAGGTHHDHTAAWESTDVFLGIFGEVDLSRTDLTGKEFNIADRIRPSSSQGLLCFWPLWFPRCRPRSLQTHTPACALVKPIPLRRLADATVQSCLPSYPDLFLFLFLSCKSLARTGPGFTVLRSIHPSIPLRSGRTTLSAAIHQPRPLVFCTTFPRPRCRHSLT